MFNKHFEIKLREELERINYPVRPWTYSSTNQFDVAIIGAGMAGLAAAFALKRLGISNIIIFDQSEAGLEGPWATCARMPILRSTKELVGPALDIPSLTFRAWYEAQFGPESWEALGKIPTLQWMDYLKWFRQVLQLPIENEKRLSEIIPKTNGLHLIINGELVTANKIILATGRSGFGGSFIPSFVNSLPETFYVHTNNAIDFKSLKGKKIGVVGGGASGFDAAAAALEQGASHVDILVRRPRLPHVNKAASITYPGFTEGYYWLSDEKRWSLLEACYKNGSPPPVEALERIKDRPNFSVKLGTRINEATWANDQIYIATSTEMLDYNFLILATGFAIDGGKQPELSTFFDQILLWKDRPAIETLVGPKWFYQSPYLGQNFQFLERNPGNAHFLKNIYCFNYAATLSHGLLSSDIPAIGVGAMRLARGIAGDFFSQDWEDYYHFLKKYQTAELSEDNYNFFI